MEIKILGYLLLFSMFCTNRPVEEEWKFHGIIGIKVVYIKFMHGKVFLMSNLIFSNNVVQYICCIISLQRPKSCDLYINVCSWTRIPKPKTGEDPISVTGGPLEDDSYGHGMCLSLAKTISTMTFVSPL